MTTNDIRPIATTRLPLRSVGTLLTAALTIALGALGSAAPADAAGNTFVAIAWSSGNGVHGWANNQPTRNLAESSALVNCRKAGGDNCTIAVTWINGCAALFATPPAGDNPNWGPANIGTGATPDDAQQAAFDASRAFDAASSSIRPMPGIPLAIRCSTGDAGQG